MNGLLSVIRKEFMHLRRDSATLRIAVVLPVLQLIIFGYAINFDVRHIQTVVVDQDQSRESRQYLQQVKATEYIDPIYNAETAEEAAEMLRNGAARVGITIPHGFARIMEAGGNPQVGIMIDGSDAQVSVRARFAFISPPAKLSPGTPDPRINVLFNPDSSTANFMIPGLIVIILQVVTVSLTAFSIVREKEQGTLEQLMVTPVGRLALMIGKLVPYACLALGELFVVIFLSDVVFGVDSSGSIIMLAIMSTPFVFASLALGLLISTVVETQGQALQYSQLVLLPSILLSGYVSPRETMPGWLYVISSFLPATHFMQISRGIIIRGAGFADLLTPFSILIVMAVVLVALSTVRFRKSVA